MSEGWLRCDVLKGMFSSERAIRYPVGTGSSRSAITSVFVPKDDVRGQVDEVGSVKVRWLSNESGLWAFLPDEVQTLIAVLDQRDLVRS